MEIEMSRKQSGGNPARKALSGNTVAVEMYARVVGADVVSLGYSDEMLRCIDLADGVENPLPESQRPVFSLAVAQSDYQGVPRVFMGLKGLTRQWPRIIKAVTQELPCLPLWDRIEALASTLAKQEGQNFDRQAFIRSVAENVAQSMFITVVTSARHNWDEEGYMTVLPDAVFDAPASQKAWPTKNTEH